MTFATAETVATLSAILLSPIRLSEAHRVNQLLADSNSNPSFPQVQQCPPSKGGGICPLQNTCCPIRLSNGTIHSGCIPSDLGASVATCCADQLTGCGVGYQCLEDELNNRPVCKATAEIQDPLVQELPRYPLCHKSKNANFQHIQRFVSPSKFPTAEMLYYSSHGDIQHWNHHQQNMIHKVLIVIHGANRNADDYFCSASAAVLRASQPLPDQVLLLAPRFVVPQDLPPTVHLGTETGRILQWDGNAPNGAWRYGANAIAPLTATNVSSFDVLDAFVETIRSHVGMSCNRITVVGHSSGGQFVQRWALLSDQAQHVQTVVANPSSYAYLTPQRYDTNTGSWKVPGAQKDCLHRYNQWEWGMEMSKDETSEYVRRRLQNRNQTDAVIERFATRQVVYLVGTLDRCNASSSDEERSTPATTKPWCYSHGLETTCMDHIQGSNRWERNVRYLEMLKLVIPSSQKYHKRVVVPGVGHDHSLMFSSPQGLEVLLSKSSSDEMHSINPIAS
ncbi:expressed unknown protein [Seminavis robusta]|uniref:AB hydrolase-1 domain-containing protein n=1 Tax=Seminavis robusta TaxID=568900 RepID=A0A9N8HTN0_9STRA|nr:expressed unknown protein [Seminavis robusta]|eukprot:Sro1910_g304870.1 n/a (506) ;mRNA; f:4565-6082